MSTPIDRAATICGGVTKLADAIGVSVQTVINWRERGIPAERCPSIERATREAGEAVLCEELKPGIEWEALRAKAAA
jgi:DNA-binding transcriptional regulator YdaS (Cro superfamily)